MMLASLLQELDECQDSNKRLIGADWLTEQGYALEASYYRWLVATDIEPHSNSDFCEWFGPRMENYIHLPHLKKALIKDSPLWQLLPSGLLSPNLDNYLRVYRTYAEAIANLRQAFLLNKNDA